MDSARVQELLQDESFINFCLQKNKEDVRHWENWLADHPENEAQVLHVKNLVASLNIGLANKQAETQYQKLQQLISDRSAVTANPKITVFNWYKFAGVAASILIVILAGLFYYTSTNRRNTATNYAANKAHDITPGGNKALLILSNGRRVDLTDASTGVLVNETGLKVSKTADGQLVYEAKPSINNSGKSTTLQMNTVETPAKGQYTVTLPDGTKVWLNAKTSLTYPTSFEKHSRTVSLNGEAYFEVAHINDAATGKRMPFRVNVTSSAVQRRDQQIEVLGTHFNINSYGDEPQTVTTLLEGSVKVKQVLQNAAIAKETVLQPGQALLNGENFKVVPADLESTMAWKNGDFVFREDIGSALRKVARWYDVDVIYLTDAPRNLRLGGWISRKHNISDVLNMMEATGKVHLKLDGRRLLVTE